MNAPEQPDTQHPIEQPKPTAIVYVRPGADPIREAEALGTLAFLASHDPDAFRYRMGQAAPSAFREPR